MSALCPCCQHPGTPGQCPRSHVLHWLPTKGSSPFQLGETVAPSSALFPTWGISATCSCCIMVPKTWTDFQSPLPGLQLPAPAGMAESGCCGISMAVTERGWHPGQAQVANPGGEA